MSGQDARSAAQADDLWRGGMLLGFALGFLVGAGLMGLGWWLL